MNEIFKAIYDRLTAQLTPVVYDHVPQDLNVYPFVRLDPVQPVPNDTDTETGFIAEIQVISYSRNENYEGNKEIVDLTDSIYNALHRYALPDTANFGISGINETFRSISTDADGLTRIGAQRYNIIFEPLP